MINIKSFVVIGAISLLVACGSSPQQKKDIADARLTEEKTKTIKEYKDCIQRAKQDTAKLDACERLLKAVDPGSATTQ
jgi:major membrane immunogen (membrane-anchored lipoprotein)